MILVLSQELSETTTEEVCDWVAALGGTCLRLNGEDLNGAEPFAMRYDDDAAELEMGLTARPFAAEGVRVVWMRRWHTYANLEFVNGLDDATLARDVRNHLISELRAVTGSLEHLLRHAEWLSPPREHSVNKLRALQLAARAGLAIPATLVTNDKRGLREFVRRHGRVIVKPVSNAHAFIHRNTGYAMYTAEVTPAHLDGVPERFFPTLVQERLAKEYEVRTFYFDGECHSMAIFSQSDAQTQQDFRQYNFRRMNRSVPYRLPGGLEDRVREFMASVPLSTGSLDFVRTPDGRHVFLEVNPAGQFGMVSQPCNYRLEKRVAEYLVARDVDPAARERARAAVS